jgi:hypothetical protein
MTLNKHKRIISNMNLENSFINSRQSNLEMSGLNESRFNTELSKGNRNLNKKQLIESKQSFSILKSPYVSESLAQINSKNNKETTDTNKGCTNTSTNTYDEAKMIQNQGTESIEEIHLKIVNILQASNKFIKMQEIINEKDNIFGTVHKCEEKDIE